eukprot:g9008.t1
MTTSPATTGGDPHAAAVAAVSVKKDGQTVEDVLAKVRQGMKQVKVPTAGNKVYKDECCYSFDSPFSPSGLFVNLQTWFSCGERFLATDSVRSNSNLLYLKLKYTKVYREQAEKEKEVTTLGIGVAGGFAAQEFELKKEYWLVVFDEKDHGVLAEIPYPFKGEAEADMPMLVAQCCEAVEKHAGAAAMAASTVWEDKDELKPSKHADNLVQLDPSTKKLSPDPSTWKCEIHGTTDNLWLNLSDGFIGGGRKNWDGSGGSGGALEHYEAEKQKGNNFPLAVKLGTITPQGADVFSYAPDENDLVIDPKLSDHLAHWGIDIMKQEKTAKTMAELTVELNANYDWGKVCESGASLERLAGAGFVGFVNLGNTCYMNSCLQLLLSLPEVRARYVDPNLELRLSVPRKEELPTDLLSQFAKVATATNLGGELQKSRYPPRPDGYNDDDSNTIAMRMFRAAAVENTSDFSTNRQQDAEEFLRYFFTRLAAAEKKGTERISKSGGGAGEASIGGATEDMFMFQKEERYESIATPGEVAYLGGVDCFLQVMIDMEDAETGPAAKKQKTESGEEAVREKAQVPEIPFERALSRIFEPEDMGPEHLFRNRRAKRSLNLVTMPKYLLVQIQRYYVDSATWTQKKRECTCPVPETLDLEKYRAPPKDEAGSGKCRPGETLMPDDGGKGAKQEALEADMELVTALQQMGFSENGCKRACLAVKNRGVEEASEWIFAHMEDPDFNDPPVPPEPDAGGGDAGGQISADMQESAALLQAITGYAEKHCLRALKQNSNNPDMAAAWLMERSAEDLDALDAADQAAAVAGGNGGSSSAGAFSDGPGKYSLCGFISHVGKATSSGHYVAHLKKDGQWCLFDDEKVAKSEKTPFEYGYVYCFRRND